jgi:hypothetical protein
MVVATAVSLLWCSIITASQDRVPMILASAEPVAQPAGSVTGEHQVPEQPAPAKKQERGADDAGFIERFSWKQSVEGATQVVVHNPFGDARLRFGGYAHELEIAAALQQLSPELGRLEVVVNVDGETVTVTVIRSTKTGEERPKQADPRAPRSRADLVLLVPEGLDARAETDSGLIACKGVRGDVELVTRTGKISARGMKGRILARTDRGDIEIVLEPGVTEASQVVESVTGNISVFVADAADLDVTLATSGEITTDFSIDIEHRDLEEPSKRGTARVGEGGRSLEILSKRGHIRLGRLLSAKGSRTGDDPATEDEVETGSRAEQKPVH